MELVKIKTTATLVAQFAAGSDIEAVQHDGKIFLPAINLGELITSAPAPTEKPKKKAEPEDDDEEDDAPSSPAEKKSGAKTYTEDELMEMPTKDLLKLCTSMGIDPDATAGKNTNKKLRNLILDAQEGSDDDDEEDDEEDDSDDTPVDDELVNSVVGVLEDFDGGKKNKKKSVAAICALIEGADKDEVSELLDKFEDDASADTAEYAEKIVRALAGDASDEEEDDDEEDEDEPKPAKSKKSKKDDDLVAPEDLKVGDRVSVWWDDDNKDWFDGEVKTITKKGKVVIAYDDDSEEAIDPEVHTKIKRIK